MDFVGFTYNGVHSIRDLKIYRTSNGSRYDENMTATMTDLTADVPGGDGQYYFGTTFKNRTFQINFAFDNLFEEDLAKIKQTFRGDGIHDLVFDETPYKAWSAKVTGTATLKHLCFEEKYLDSSSGTEKIRRVYKGEGNVTFTCYYPYAHTPEKLWAVINKGTSSEQWFQWERDGKNKDNYVEAAYPNKKEWLTNNILTDSNALNNESNSFRKICGDRNITFTVIINILTETYTSKLYITKKDSSGATVVPESVIKYNGLTLSAGEQLIFNSKTRILIRKQADKKEIIIPYSYEENPFTIQPGTSFAPTLAHNKGTFTYTCEYNFEYL